MSPWVVRNTFLAWGPDFKRGTTVRTPASNVDLAPTLLALMNLDKDAGLDRFDGRVLREAFADGPDEEQVPFEVHTYFAETADGSYRGDPDHRVGTPALRRQELAHSVKPGQSVSSACVRSGRVAESGCLTAQRVGAGRGPALASGASSR
jgi:arylsulfatase A-like enzyme